MSIWWISITSRFSIFPLQKELPYHLKPKVAAKGSSGAEGRVAVVLDTEERKVTSQMKKLRALYSNKVDREKADVNKRMDALIKKKTGMVYEGNFLSSGVFWDNVARKSKENFKQNNHSRI